MLRPLLFVVQAIAASAAIAHPQSAPGEPTADTMYQVIARPTAPIEAPADVYFGRYKLSNLGVRNAIRDMTIEGDSPLALPLQTGRINAVESALPDWANRYPHDPWLPSAIVKFSVFLVSKQQPDYDRAALAWLYLLAAWYPRTWYGEYAQTQLEAFDLIPNIDLESGPTTGQLARVSQGDFPSIGANHRRH
jgi:hypothetical protein